LYQEYFGIPESPLFVGAKRFAVKEIYPEDLVKAPGGKFGTKMFSDLASKTCKGADRSQQVTNLQIEAAVQIVREIGEPGTSMLIFVSGMAEIVEICGRFENLQGGVKKYKIIPIHSELPDEEQAEAFASAPKMVKVLVATNVAESSITIPDCDTVVCFLFITRTKILIGCKLFLYKKKKKN
jgi:HrpA-like RNA helicase